MVLCVFTCQQVHGGTGDRRLTPLIKKGAMLSISTTPPRILFPLESEYICRVVKTGVYHQLVWLWQVAYVLTGRSNQCQDF